MQSAKPSESPRLPKGLSKRSWDIYCACRAGYSYDQIAQHFGTFHWRIRRHIARALLAIMDDEWYSNEISRQNSDAAGDAMIGPKVV